MFFFTTVPLLLIIGFIARRHVKKKKISKEFENKSIELGTIGGMFGLVSGELIFDRDVFMNIVVCVILFLLVLAIIIRYRFIWNKIFSTQEFTFILFVGLGIGISATYLGYTY